MGGGFGRTLIAAAAAAPIVRDYLHGRRRSGDSDDSDGTVIPSRSTQFFDTHLRSSQSPDEMARRPLVGVETHLPGRQSSGGYGAGYGTILGEGSSSLRGSPERMRRDSWLDRVPEEGALDEHDDDLDEDEEWDLAEQGYYSGSYKRTLAWYTLVPLTSVVAFTLFGLLPEWIWHLHRSRSTTLPRLLPSPLPEVLISAAFWSFAHVLRAPLYGLISLYCPRILDTVLFNALHVLLSLLLRLATVALLCVQPESQFARPTWRDSTFPIVWWLALGWALAETTTSVAQGYQQLALYRNVMVPLERVREILAQSKAQAQWGTGSMDGSREYMSLSPRIEHPSSEPDTRASRTRRRAPISVEEAVRMAVDQDVEQLINLQEREELEEVYGTPVVYIPVFVPCLQRVNSFLFSVGFTLVLAWAYLLSPLSFPPDATPPPRYSNHALAIAFPAVFAVHLFLSLLHAPPVLPRIGVHTTAYVGLLVGLGAFFTGLGLWDALS